jgi:hypothetical protein
MARSFGGKSGENLKLRGNIQEASRFVAIVSDRHSGNLHLGDTFPIIDTDPGVVDRDAPGINAGLQGE